MLGLESSFSIGKQSSATNPSTLARQSINAYSINGGQTEDDEDDNILGGTLENLSDPVKPAPGLDDHKVTLEVALCSAQFPFVAAAFFGAEALTDNDPDFTHEWKSGRALRYCFIEHQLKSGRFRRHFGCVGESMMIDLDAERAGYGKATFTFVGLSETKAASALAGTVTAAPALVRPAQKTVVGIYNGVSGGDLMGGKFTFTRKLKRVRGADGTGIPYAIEYDGISSLKGSIRTRSHDETFVDDAVAKTARTFALHMLNTSSNGMKFIMANMRLDRSPISVSGPAGVEHEFGFTTWQSNSDAVLKVQALNQEDAAELP